MHALLQYIKFLFKSSNQHGVHSPFIYNLVTRCFYDKGHYDAYKHIVNYKKSLLKNKTYLSVTDLGVGSHVMKRNKRQIASMAKHAGTTNKRAKLAYRLVKYFESKTILELGTSLGITTHAMSLANENNEITTIEGCPNLSKFSKGNLERKRIKHVNIKIGDFMDHIPSLSTNKYDLVFFDGNHQKEATLKYFETLLPTVHNNTVFIFDDIHWSRGMTETWENIKKHPKVTVTIDTFFWGVVFFRREQGKEHFTIRI